MAKLPCCFFERKVENVNIEKTIKELYDKYNFEKSGYIKNEDIQYQKMSPIDTNKKEVFNAFEISNGHLNKHKVNCVFVDGMIFKSVISIRSSFNVFVNVNFNESKFDSCGFKETVFINCLFEDVDFKVSGLYDVIFLNCQFEECRLNDLDLESVYFINSNPTDIINVLTEENFKVDTPNIHLIDDETVFGIFKEEQNSNNILQKNVNIEEMNREERGEKNMYTINDKKFINENVSLTSSYHDCEFINVTFMSEVCQDNYFQNCQFVDCTFVDLKFRSVIFDDSSFTGCRFESVSMNRCSLINVEIDEKTVLGVEFISCQNFNMKVQCSLSSASFQQTYNPKELKEEKHTKGINSDNSVNYDTVLFALQDIIEKMKTEDYKKSIENEREVTEKDVYDYFREKEVSVVMMMISKITSSCIENKSNKIEENEVM